MTPIIERNTTIPVRRSQIFSTAEDNQTAVDIHVLQGERTMAADNITLGRFRLDGIPPAPRGIPQIEVTFDIDANGILNVSAKDKATGKEQRVTITASTNLSKAEIERMVEESKRHEAEDRRRREIVEARNLADNVIYQVEKALKENGERVPSDLRYEAESKISDLRQIMNGEDDRRMRSLSEELQQLYGRILQAAAPQAAGTPPGGNGHHGQTSPEGDVVEGEFKEA